MAKVKFNRTVKHNGRLYEAGKVYEFDGELEADVKALTELVHTDVHTKTSEADEEMVNTVPVAEEAPEGAVAEAQPAPLPKTPKIGAQPNVQG
jgi:hypothetical protein